MLTDDVRLKEKEVVSKYFIQLNIVVSKPLLYFIIKTLTTIKSTFSRNRENSNSQTLKAKV